MKLEIASHEYACTRKYDVGTREFTRSRSPEHAPVLHANIWLGSISHDLLANVFLSRPRARSEKDTYRSVEFHRETRDVDFFLRLARTDRDIEKLFVLRENNLRWNDEVPRRLRCCDVDSLETNINYVSCPFKKYWRSLYPLKTIEGWRNSRTIREKIKR